MRRAILAAVLMIVALGVPGVCWGPAGHELIVRNAVELLPEGLKPFYDRNERYVAALVTLPDDWRDTHKAEIGPDHFIDLDLLAEPPFTGLIMERAEAEKKFGKEKVLQAGVLPWAIQDRWNRLVTAFKSGDTSGIVLQSAVLAHLVGDAHVPFHNSKVYDGKTPEQKGVHNRWEEILLAGKLKPESIKPQSAEAVEDVLKSAFGWSISSFDKLDAIYKAEDKARAADPGHGYGYYNSVYRDTGSIMRERITHASQATAGAIIAAWKAAGQPQIADKVAPLLWGQ